MTSRRFTISLRVLLVVILALGLWLGWLAHRARQQRLAVAAIRDYGGFVYYEHQMVRLPNGGLKPDPTLEPSAPRWLRRLLGDDYFQRVAWVNIVYDYPTGRRIKTLRNDDAILSHIKSMGGLRVLILKEGQVTDAGLANIRDLHNPETVMLWDAGELTDEGVACLKGLNRLRYLHINDSKMTDEGLKHLAGLPNLEVLWVQQNHFTDKGLGYIEGLGSLKKLCVGLGCREITDAGMEHLRGMSELELLDLQGSQVTDAGLMKLKDLPKLREIWINAGPSQVSPGGIMLLKAAMPQLRTIQ